jgi:glucose/arabinose dehydrogenase
MSRPFPFLRSAARRLPRLPAVAGVAVTSAVLALAVLLGGSGSPAAAQVTSQLAIDGLIHPIRLVAPLGDPRLFVVEKEGRIRVFNGNGTERGTFLDLRGRLSVGSEQGLLGLAFAPDYATSGRFYVDFTDPAGDSRLVRYHVSANPDAADAASADTLMTIDQPYDNHNGGHLEFGPDGMLYWGLGDGGGGGDPGNRAQDGQSLLGKLLRLDVSGPGAVPAAGNPYLATPERDEIWALGLRNPWCFSFDRLTGDLYIGDVGQSAYEEVDIEPAGSGGGRNYGWRLMEGFACYNPSTGCNDGSLVLPVHDYAHGGTPFRCSVSGGYVYRGNAIPSLRGTYLFADYCSGEVWGFEWTAAGGRGPVLNRSAEMEPPTGFGSIPAFGQDAAGELYVLSYGAGRAWRLVPDTTAVGPPPARALQLLAGVPNPFNGGTELAWTADPAGGPVELAVFGTDGRRVLTLATGPAPDGEQRVRWDGTDGRGRHLPAGVYLCRLAQDGTVLTTKVALLK